MSEKFDRFLTEALTKLKSEGLYKSERVIEGPQQAIVSVDNQSLINLCANNYLGLANHPLLINAAKKALDSYGYGMASVRFICGTQTPHYRLERQLADFLQMEDVILYSSCFDANGGLFETLFDAEDAIISDALNHASIIDGIRLCKAARYRYANNDMQALEEQLIAASHHRFRLIATDGVFSMDGTLANLPRICELAEQYDAMVMVDDSHAVGFMGNTGRGTPEHFGVQDKIDILTGTLGKALGGASGGYIAANQQIVTWLRQRSRPYLFSNSLAPMIAESSLMALDIVLQNTQLRDSLHRNAAYFRAGLAQGGFDLIPGEHPIIPVMVGEAELAQRMAQDLLAEGVYVIGFFYPVVPKGLARIRTQMSASLTTELLDKAIAAFIKVGRAHNVI